MQFQDTQPIFIQIVDHIIDRILRDELKTDEQVPSVRELAVKLGVNPNTVMRAFERLTMADLIYNRRGLGYFVKEGAKEAALSIRRQRLFDDALPKLVTEMKLLGISREELLQRINL